MKSGRQVLANLDHSKYQARAVVISKKGSWPVRPAEIKNRFDVAFIAMHGEYGEDGTIQKILDKYRIKYTGSGAKASALGMDKVLASATFTKAGLKVPKFSLLKIKNGNLVSGNHRQSMFHLPVVVKPTDRGSSAGTTVVKKIQELLPAIQEAAKFSENIMVQEYIEGREFTCGVVEVHPHTKRALESGLRGGARYGVGVKGKLKALPPTEIVPKLRGFFDYYSKYTSGASREITPPHIGRKEIKKIQALALKAHLAIGARGMSRTDFMQDADGKFYVLEINTLPGMTATSLLPQEAKAAGIDFPELLDLIITSGLAK